MKSIRRVVTGHDPSGKSVFVVDDEVEGLRFDLHPGWEYYKLWGGDATPTFPDSGDQPAVTNYFPAVDGFRFTFSVVPPAGTLPVPGLDIAKATAEAEAGLPGLMAYLEPDGMHTTDTIDFEVIISGEVILELDDGEQRLLKPGDTVVQNGTRHVWRNPGTEPCVMVVFLLGAHRKTP